MPLTKSANRPKPGIPCVAVCAVFLMGSASGAQDAPKGDERDAAFKLCKEHKEIEALPLLEKLHKAAPEDDVVKEYLACALVSTSGALEGDEQATRLTRAKRMLGEIKAKRPLSNLGEILLDMVPADGIIPPASSKAGAADAMKKGEAAFSRREFAKARASYEAALALDPTLYRAAVFAGDAYFGEGKMQEAIDWFARAAKIDPDAAVAYRYWGDALMRQGKQAEARQQFFAGIIAEPYARPAWISLMQWAKANSAEMTHPAVLPELDLEKKPDAATEDGSFLVLLYKTSRARWKEEGFKERFPKERAYRHSLDEERESLHVVALLARQSVKAGKIKALNPMLANLIKLEDEGLLDAYILFARPDEGIVKDYPAYREKNRAKLLEYLNRYVATPAEQEKKP
jgi:tetratricopeptide (TPR) repeat protein